MTPSFDFTINIGGVLALIAIIITLLGMHHSNLRRLASMEAKITILFDWWTNEQRRRKGEP